MTLNTENIANPQMEPKSSSRKCNQVFGITDSESFTPLLKTLCPHFWNLIKASQSDWRILAFLLIQRWSCESVLDHCPALELQGMNRWPDNRLPDCLVETTRSWSKSAPDHDHHHACLLAWCSWCYARCNGTQKFTFLLGSSQNTFPTVSGISEMLSSCVLFTQQSHFCTVLNHELWPQGECDLHLFRCCFLFIYDLQDESPMNSWSNFGIIIV